jgi:hypothetical protein
MHRTSYVSRLGAEMHGAELMLRLRHVDSHFNDMQKMALDFSVNDQAPRSGFIF